MLFSRALLLGCLLATPFVFLAGCGGGGGIGNLSGANPLTQAGLGTLIVSVSGASGSTAVLLDKIGRPVTDGRATFYDVTPGKHTVTVTSPLSLPSSATVKIVADRTLKVSLSVDNGFIPTPTSTRPGF